MMQAGNPFSLIVMLTPKSKDIRIQDRCLKASWLPLFLICGVQHASGPIWMPVGILDNLSRYGILLGWNSIHLGQRVACSHYLLTQGYTLQAPNLRSQVPSMARLVSLLFPGVTTDSFVAYH